MMSIGMKKVSYDSVKAIISFLILLLAFGIFMLFYMNSDVIVRENKFFLFISLATIGMGLLIGLMYLVNNQAHLKKQHVAKPVAKAKSPAAKKKTKKKGR
jgi:hypothetical protein